MKLPWKLWKHLYIRDGNNYYESQYVDQLLASISSLWLQACRTCFLSQAQDGTPTCRPLLWTGQTCIYEYPVAYKRITIKQGSLRYPNRWILLNPLKKITSFHFFQILGPVKRAPLAWQQRAMVTTASSLRTQVSSMSPLPSKL